MKSDLLSRLQARGAGYLPGHLGIEITAATAEKIEGCLNVEPHLIAPNGFVHAATIIGLVDTLCGYGVVANLPEGASGFTTIELKSNFLATTKSGDVVQGEATPVHLGRSTQVWDAQAKRRSDGRALALFRCTQMVLWPKG